MSRPIITERTTFAEIPCLHIRRSDLDGPAPTLFFLHGWCSQKDDHIITAEALAIDGFRLILPDAPHHGERDPLPEYFTAAAWARYWPIVRQALNEAVAIKDDLVRSGLADPERIGAAGNSMGGMIGSSLLALNSWVKVGGFTCTSLTQTALEERSKRARQEAPLTEGELAALRAHDPEYLIDEIAPRPLLLIHGGEDKSQPVEEIRRFAELARPAYAAHPERLHVQEYSWLGHVMVPSMIMLLRDWFLRYL